MTDLISREAILAAVKSGEHTTDTIIQIENAPAAQIVVVIKGGCVEQVIANAETDVIVLDRDTEGAEPDQLGNFMGDEVFPEMITTDVEPEVVDAAKELFT